MTEDEFPYRGESLRRELPDETVAETLDKVDERVEATGQVAHVKEYRRALLGKLPRGGAHHREGVESDVKHVLRHAPLSKRIIKILGSLWTEAKLTARISIYTGPNTPPEQKRLRRCNRFEMRRHVPVLDLHIQRAIDRRNRYVAACDSMDELTGHDDGTLVVDDVIERETLLSRLFRKGK